MIYKLYRSSQCKKAPQQTREVVYCGAFYIIIYLQNQQQTYYQQQAKKCYFFLKKIRIGTPVKLKFWRS